MKLVSADEVVLEKFLVKDAMEKAYRSTLRAAIVYSPPLHINATKDFPAQDFEESWRAVLLDANRREIFSDNRLASEEAGKKWCELHGYEFDVWHNRDAYQSWLDEGKKL